MQFEIVSKVSGSVVAVADDDDEALYVASAYQMNPDLEFVGIDELGREVGRWSITAVLQGELATFEV